MLPEARQLGARPDAADHPAMAAVAKLLRRLARQFAAALVDLERTLGDVEFRQRDRGAAERVGLHHVGAGLEVAAMDVAHQIGPRQVQHVGAVLLAPVSRVPHPASCLHAAAHARRRTAAPCRAAHRADGVGTCGNLQTASSAGARPSRLGTGGGPDAHRHGEPDPATVSGTAWRQPGTPSAADAWSRQ